MPSLGWIVAAVAIAALLVALGDVVTGAVWLLAFVATFVYVSRRNRG